MYGITMDDIYKENSIAIEEQLHVGGRWRALVGVPQARRTPRERTM